MTENKSRRRSPTRLCAGGEDRGLDSDFWLYPLGPDLAAPESAHNHYECEDNGVDHPEGEGSCDASHREHDCCSQPLAVSHPEPCEEQNAGYETDCDTPTKITAVGEQESEYDAVHSQQHH